MRNFLLLFLKRGSFIVFIILEVIAFTIIVKYNHSQREIFLNSSNLFSGSVNKKYNNLAKYFELNEINKQLTIENAQLKSALLNTSSSSQAIPDTNMIIDSARYKLMPAEICNNTLKFHNNYLTIDKGTKHGIKKSMGVVGDNGIVGIVRNVSGRFAQVLSILNEQIRISVIIKNKNYLGNLTWNGTDPTRMIVNAIPKHSFISLGDTIITSGYSSIFPKGIEIGTVERFWVHESNGNDYNIIVKLFINMNNLSSCYVIDNTLLNEQKSVEKE